MIQLSRFEPDYGCLIGFFSICPVGQRLMSALGEHNRSVNKIFVLGLFRPAAGVSSAMGMTFSRRCCLAARRGKWTASARNTALRRRFSHDAPFRADRAPEL